MEDSLLETESKKKRHPASCVVPTVHAVVFGVLFVGALIGVIVLAAGKGLRSDSSSSTPPSPPTPPTPVEPVLFEHYSAEYYAVHLDGKFAPNQYHHLTKHLEKTFVFEPHKWYMNVDNANGTFFFRTYSTAADNSVTACLNLSNHGNCFTTTSGDDQSFTTSGLELIGKSLSCSSLFPYLKTLIPERELDKCDYYTLLVSVSGFDKKIEVVLESGTNYPVVVSLLNYDGWYTDAKVFKTFNPEMPTDESGLGPFPGVTVYDLRNGEGDCGDEGSFSTRSDDSFTQFSHGMLQRQMVGELLHMPIDYVPQVNPVHLRSTVVRDSLSIPPTFDAREQWPYCAGVINAITNQNPCGSCWAMSSSAVLADRMCIVKNVTEQLSPQYMVYCGKESTGCQGASIVAAWEQLIEQGTVSERCVPFAGRNGACPKRCNNQTLITDDMHVRAKGYVLPWGNSSESRVQAIQSEIMERGSVQTLFQVFSDFQNYESGIYHRLKNATLVGGHLVRIIGWGTSDDNVDYWLGVNSWGVEWGENGFFRIRRGNNECNFEEQVAAGIVE